MVEDLAAAVPVRLPEGDQTVGALHLRVPGGHAVEERHRRTGHPGGLPGGHLCLFGAADRGVLDHRSVQIQAADRGVWTFCHRSLGHAALDQDSVGVADFGSKSDLI